MVDASELVVTSRGVAFRGFVKRVHGVIGEPSVNHLIIVPDQAGLS
ncbi:MAG: hypothetical protein ACI8T1_003302 [Verrucomicrobiales bacterium]|jgi:hypothetical protein